MANYLVTGGCGFIGVHLVNALRNQGHSIIVFDNLSIGKPYVFRDGVECVTEDIRNYEALVHYMKRADGCFHLAAKEPYDGDINVPEMSQGASNIDILNLHKETVWQNTHSINLVGTINVFNAARYNLTPVVYASSAQVYGNNVDVPLREDSITNPINAYGADKLACEHFARVASLAHGVPTVGFRLFNVYGRRQQSSLACDDVISTFCNSIHRGEEVEIVGNGSQTRDFLFIDDAVNFLMAGMQHTDLGPMVFNACSGRAITINQLVSTLTHITGKRINTTFKASRKSEIYTSVGDPTRAYKLLGVKAKTSLYDGLSQLLQPEHISAEVMIHAHREDIAMLR